MLHLLVNYKYQVPLTYICKYVGIIFCFKARMERDMSARRIYGEEETPEGAAGSEFGKKQREEARRKKFGIVTREFKVEDQPWILKVNGKAGKR